MAKKDNLTSPQAGSGVVFSTSQRGVFPFLRQLLPRFEPNTLDPGAALTLYAIPQIQYAREQILTGLLRIGALLGSLTLLAAALSWINDTPAQVFAIDTVLVGLVWLLAHLAGMLMENVRLYDTALREIRRREQVEQTLRQQAVALQAQNAELDAFAHTVAHDLKNPLAGLIGHSQMLVEIGSYLDRPAFDQSLGSIVKIGKKMAAIIDDLLLLARVRSSDDIPHTALSMANIVAEATSRLQDSIASAGATLICPADWPIAFGYAPWIEEVWVNYISNALKYGGSPPIVELGADLAEHGSVRFWVQDNGAGLSLEQQSQLFTPFTRLQTDHALGHGLGLSIVQRIISQLRGAVGVESQPSQGCRFYFTLPASAT